MLLETPKKKSMEKYEVFAQSFPEGRIATPRHASLHRPTTRGRQAAASMYVSTVRLAFFARARDNGQLEDRHFDVLRVTEGGRQGGGREMELRAPWHTRGAQARFKPA